MEFGNASDYTEYTHNISGDICHHIVCMLCVCVDNVYTYKYFGKDYTPIQYGAVYYFYFCDGSANVVVIVLGW